LTYVQNENSSAPGAGDLLSGLRPFGALVGNNSITYYSHGSSSNYQSLQTQFTAQLNPRTRVQASYTWSKLLADSQRLDTPQPNVDGEDRHNSYGPDLLNHPHIFNGSVVVGLPMLSNSNALVRGALGGWESSVLLNISDGPSITPQVSVQGLGDPSGVGNGTATSHERADRVDGESCRASGADPKTWLNPSMFTVNGFQLGKIGTAGVGLCSGPPTRVVDLGVDKNFKITERVKMQFRMEFFNLFNHPLYTAQDVINNETLNFNSPVFGDANGNVVTPNANGVLVGATQILSATPAPSSNFGRAQSVRENGYRQIQYALKIIF
jgi:hypothetical protein